MKKNQNKAFADSVFSVKLRKGGDKKCLISILIEHKSYADDRAAFQILHYLAQGYHQQLKGRKKRRPPKSPLRPIVPLLFYHGKKGWKLRPLRAQFDNKVYGSILQYVPNIEVVFADVADMSEEDIGRVADAWLQAALLTWKYSHDPAELLRRLAAIFRLISRGRMGNFFYELAVYVISLINIPEEEIMEALDSLPQDIKQNMMST